MEVFHNTRKLFRLHMEKLRYDGLSTSRLSPESQEVELSPSRLRTHRPKQISRSGILYLHLGKMHWGGIPEARTSKDECGAITQRVPTPLSDPHETDKKYRRSEDYTEKNPPLPGRISHNFPGDPPLPPMIAGRVYADELKNAYFRS